MSASKWSPNAASSLIAFTHPVCARRARAAMLARFMRKSAINFDAVALPDQRFGICPQPEYTDARNFIRRYQPRLSRGRTKAQAR